MKTTYAGNLLSFICFSFGFVVGIISGNSYSVSLIGGCMFGILIFLWNLKE